MASALASKKLSTELYVKGFDVDPDATTQFYVGWVDMRDFGAVLMRFFRTIGTSDLQTFAIYAASDASGTNATEVKTATVDPDAVGDQVFLECTAAEIAHLDAGNVGLRYVSLRLQFATGTDEGVADYIFGCPRFPREGLTSDIVA